MESGMKKGGKGIWISLLAAAVLAAVWFFLYRRAHRRTFVTESVSPDRSAVVRIEMIGDPEFPFGPTVCEAVLRRNETQADAVTIELKNDGKTADETNFEIRWTADGAEITARGEEMEPQVYTLSCGVETEGGEQS
jgi:hypothetical protein